MEGPTAAPPSETHTTFHLWFSSTIYSTETVSLDVLYEARMCRIWLLLPRQEASAVDRPYSLLWWTVAHLPFMPMCRKCVIIIWDLVIWCFGLYRRRTIFKKVEFCHFKRWYFVSMWSVIGVMVQVGRGYYITQQRSRVEPTGRVRVQSLSGEPPETGSSLAFRS